MTIGSGDAEVELTTTPPGLFGLVHTNRDFSKEKYWGKNQFNSSFPAALACFMHHKELKAKYLFIDQGKYKVGSIPIQTLFGANPLGVDTFFSFESAFSRFNALVLGTLPNTDLVISSLGDPANQYRPLEVKLTALPDIRTAGFTEDKYGSELVVRPDTIFYLCATLFLENELLIKGLFAENQLIVSDWADAEEVLRIYEKIGQLLKEISRDETASQSPVLLQPVWKTKGQTPQLADNCLDLFAWSSLGFLDFLIENGLSSGRGIGRPMRTVVWVYKVLKEMAEEGRTNFVDIVNTLSYNNKNDKAFAANGMVMHKYMNCSELTTPRITKDQIKSIVLGGGQKFLSPERRFDAILVNSPEIF